MYKFQDLKYSSIEQFIQEFDPNNDGLKIDIGCGYYKKEGCIGLDNLSSERVQHKSNNGPDIIMDLIGNPLPFPDNSCSEIFSSHFIEHVPYNKLAYLMDEIFRVLREDGIFNFFVPYANSDSGMYPGHEIFLTELFFDDIQFQELFHISERRYRQSSTYLKLPRGIKLLFPFDTARKVLFNMCDEIYTIAKPRKGIFLDTSTSVMETSYLPPNVNIEELEEKNINYIEDWLIHIDRNIEHINNNLFLIKNSYFWKLFLPLRFIKAVAVKIYKIIKL